MAWTSCVDRDLEEVVQRLGSEALALSGSRILLTGGLGFLGQYFLAVFRRLNEQVLHTPCRVTVVDNRITETESGAPLWRHDGFQLICQDAVQPLVLEEPVDMVIHAAGIASPYYYRKYPLETLEVATVGTKHLLQLAVRNPLKSFLFLSSSEIYGDPDSKHVPTPESYRGHVSCLGPRACYDESKRLGETLCFIFHEMYGIPTKIVRPFNIYGPGMRENDYRIIPNCASRIIGQKPVRLFGTGRQTRTFCYITDAIVGFLKVLLQGTPGQAYNIGNVAPEVSMLELLATFELVVGHPCPTELVEYPDSYPADEPQRRCPDISKATYQLGYRPQISLEEGLRRFMEWAKPHYAGSPW